MIHNNAFMANLRRRQQYHVLGSPSEVPDILFGLNRICIFPTGFYKSLQHQISRPSGSREDRRTYMTSGFLDYVNAPKTPLKVTNLLLFMQLSCLFFFLPSNREGQTSSHEQNHKPARSTGLEAELWGGAIKQTDQREGSRDFTPSRDILLSQRKTCHFPRYAAPSRTNAIKLTGNVAFPNICQMLHVI